MNSGIAIARPDFQWQHAQTRDKYVNLEQEELRLSAASRWLGAVNKKIDASSVAARNFLVLDSVHLLMGDWPEVKSEIDAWDFTDIKRLRGDFGLLCEKSKPKLVHLPLSKTSAPNWKMILDDLAQTIEKVAKDTYPSYEAFASASENQGPMSGKDRSDRITAYEKWLKRFRSYLVLGVPWDDVDRADAMLKERVEFFLRRQDDEWGLTEHYRDKLWRHVFDVRNEVQKSAAIQASDASENSEQIDDLEEE